MLHVQTVGVYAAQPEHRRTGSTMCRLHSDSVSALLIAQSHCWPGRQQNFSSTCNGRCRPYRWMCVSPAGPQSTPVLAGP